MSNVIHKVLDFLRRIYAFLKIHIHVGVGLRISNNAEETKEGSSDDPDIKE